MSRITGVWMVRLPASIPVGESFLQFCGQRIFHGRVCRAARHHHAFPIPHNSSLAYYSSFGAFKFPCPTPGRGRQVLSFTLGGIPPVQDSSPASPY
jgi:hypothetical protein